MLEMGIGKKGMKKIPAVLRHLCNKIVIIVGFGIFYCTGGIDQLGDMLLAMAGQNGTGWLDTMLVTSVQNNLFLLIAALLDVYKRQDRGYETESRLLRYGTAFRGAYAHNHDSKRLRKVRKMAE